MSTPDSRGRHHVPAVSALAERLGVDLGAVDGTGIGGRVRLADVIAAHRPDTPTPPAAPSSRSQALAQATHDRWQTARRQDDETYLALFGEPVPRQEAPRPVSASRARPHTRPSIFNNAVEVTIDAAGPNPLLEDVAQTIPWCYEQAVQAGDLPPTVFNSGDLPPFTASGLDPKLLLELPWQVRHYAAASESRAEVLALVEQYAEDPTVVDGAYTTAGTENYLDRMRAWLVGPAAPTPDLLGGDD